MAKRRRTRRAKAKEQFIILTSSCGDMRQARYYDERIHGTLAAAKAAIGDAMEWHEGEDGDRPRGAFILKVVAQGKSTGFEWSDV